MALRVAMVAGLMTRWICLLGLLGLIDAAPGLRGTEDWTQCGTLGKAAPQKTRIVHGKERRGAAAQRSVVGWH